VSVATVNLPTGDRPGRKGIVHTMQSRFGHVVKPYLTNGILCQVSLKRTSKAIHTNTVTANKHRLNNKLLGGPQTLRCALIQLRSRNCKDVKSYQHQIGSSLEDMCPACRSASHTTAHLFTCPASPTDLGVLDLWRRPREATDFLRTSTSFNHLSLNPLYPLPPPEPPPLALGIPE
jgi:hypothetical protein